MLLFLVSPDQLLISAVGEDLLRFPEFDSTPPDLSWAPQLLAFILEQKP